MNKIMPTIKTDSSKRAKALAWFMREIEKYVADREHMKLIVTIDSGLIVHVNESKGRVPPK